MASTLSHLSVRALSTSVPARSLINNVTVIGSGLMGSGIAQVGAARVTVGLL